ncbi:MAG: 4Fe-4S binding protein [Candidatus Hydrogenedentes bacterium]|nr:4Fe-4S binding protein [Candidatus Hydrogenedentota bacterium]
MKRPQFRSPMQWARRISQALFLAAFVYLVLVARHEEEEPSRLLRVFFDFDPLVALATWMSTHTLAATSLLSLVTVVLTLTLGRIFCGWICPLGAVHNIMTWFNRKQHRKRESRSSWQRMKYALLLSLLVMALSGVHWIGIFDPMSLLYRSLTIFGEPAVQYSIEDSATSVYRSDPHIGSFQITRVTEPVYVFFRDNIFQAPRPVFEGSALIAALFILILALNLIRPRFWCRYICPLGGMLGFLAMKPLLRLNNDTDACNNCGKCARTCPAAAQPDQPDNWLPTECFTCWNCVAVCDQNALSFVLASPRKEPKSAAVDFSRRTAIGAVAGGMAAMLGFRQSPLAQGVRFEAALIRPPGALSERAFLQRCIQCGLCMRVCPTNALHPCGLEAGVEGLWTPKLVPKVGYCSHSCTLCGQVCPTGAIRSLPIEKKQEIKIGMAVFDKNRCLPYSYGRECIICEEHCPVSPKAITFTLGEATTSDGEIITLKQPQVDAVRCTGCGICEWSCVYKDQAAIRIVSANESRNPDNVVLLENSGYDTY